MLGSSVVGTYNDLAGDVQKHYPSGEVFSIAPFLSSISPLDEMELDLGQSSSKSKPASRIYIFIIVEPDCVSGVEMRTVF